MADFSFFSSNLMERKNEEFSNSGPASKLVGPNQAENIDKNFAWDNFVLRICIAAAE